MKTHGELEKGGIVYVIKKSIRAKHIRLFIHPDGSCVVTAPQCMSDEAIQKIVSTKSQWIRDTLDYVKTHRGNLYIKSSRKDYIQYKELAREIAERRLTYFNTFYGFQYRGISIRNQKTRWGSCSRKGNLNFNYKIALLPEKFADYIIVHELCHTKEFNHSRKFWNLVAQTIPDYKDIRKELRNGCM